MCFCCFQCTQSSTYSPAVKQKLGTLSRPGLRSTRSSLSSIVLFTFGWKLAQETPAARHPIGLLYSGTQVLDAPLISPNYMQD